MYDMWERAAFQEKRAWILALAAACSYVSYLTIVLGRASGTRLTDARYVPTMLWAIGLSILASIVLSILASIASPGDGDATDQRDREIARVGDHIGQSFVVIAGIAAMAMAMAELDYFWIANVVYLGFTMSAILGSVAKIFAYRRGFQAW
jgi:hypothetical protein